MVINWDRAWEQCVRAWPCVQLLTYLENEAWRVDDGEVRTVCVPENDTRHPPWRLFKNSMHAAGAQDEHHTHIEPAALKALHGY